MKLSTAHLILIRTAIAGALVYSGWGLWMYTRTGEKIYLLPAGISTSFAAGLAIYLKRFVEKLGRRDER